ncbi:unnamed protein product, partial [Closterium sp. Naga37s-1]
LLNNNWFAGSLPQTLMSLPALTLLDVHANALTGSLPAVSSVLQALFLHDNFLAGPFTPTAALTACDASLNCFTSAAACGASSTTQRAAAACAICDSTDAQGLLCWGGVCLPNVTFSTAHPDGLAPPPMYCNAAALAALKSAVGVTFSTWAAATYCTVAPTAIIAGTWTGVLCNSAGKVVTLQLANSNLTGTLPLTVSTLTALTAIDLTSNLFQGRLDEVATQLRLLTNLKAIDLAYNWLSGSVPAFMLTLPSLTEITLGYNYLTGALPPVTSPLAVVDVQFNFLGGTFPALTLSRCAARMNCFLDASKCNYPNRAAELPRAAAACAICNTTNAQGRLCSGGLCTVNATDLVALGAPNSAASPTLPLICVGAAFVAMDSVHAAAMLNLKASLGVTFTDWKADSPCSLPGAVAAGSWSGVTCDATGKVLGIVLNSQMLGGSIHSDISKLTTLTSLDLQSNLLQGRLDSFTAGIKAPLVLKELALQFNYLSGQFPSTLLALTTLSKLSVAYNYLTGPFPTVPASAKSLDVQGNFLSGSFPTNALTYCAATTNCLTDANNCASLGITQRSASDCAICGTAFGQGTLCGGVPCLVNTTGVTAPPTATSPPLNLYCTPVALDTNTSSSHRLILIPLLCPLPPLRPLSSPVPCCSHNAAGAEDGAGSDGHGLECNDGGTEAQGAEEQQRAPRHHGGRLHRRGAGACSRLVDWCLLQLRWRHRRPVSGSWRGAVKHQQSPLRFSHRCPHLTPFPSALPTGSSLQYNWFSSSIPSALLALPALSTVKLNRNYLTGVVPTVGAAVKALNVADNFLSGSFPTAALTACDARSNCFVDASKCTNTNGTAQRAAADCNVCGSTGAAGTLCGGGFCTPNATVPAGTGTPNTEGQAVLPLFCQGGPIEVNMRGAMLNLKASLGVTLTDWLATSPCNIAGQNTVPGAWSNVVCDTAGKAELQSDSSPVGHSCSDLTSQLLKGTMHADITKLTTLTSLILDSNLLQGRLAFFTSAFKGLSALKQFKARFNFFAGLLPSALLTLPTLTNLDMSYNYLTGTVPATVGTALKSLNIGGNFLSGSIGTLTGVTCSAALNCLTSQGGCTSGGVLNRAGCGICGSPDGQGTLCGGGLCVPNATEAVAGNSVPTLSTPIMSMYCTGVIIDAASVTSPMSSSTPPQLMHSPALSPVSTPPLCTLAMRRALCVLLTSDHPFLSMPPPSLCLALLLNLPHTHICPLVGLPDWTAPYAAPVTALGNIKTALGVTFTDWVAPTALLKPKAAGSTGSGSVALTDWLTTGGYCTVEGQTPVAGACVLCSSLCHAFESTQKRALQLPRPARQPVSTLSPSAPCCALVFPSAAAARAVAVPVLLFKPLPMHVTMAACNSPPRHAPPSSPPHAGRKLDNQKLTGSLHADISKLSTLTMLDVSFNFFRNNIDTWASSLKLSTNLLSLRLNNNYLFGSVPLWLVSFAKLTNLELSMNALTGTFPAPISTALKRLMVDQNFLGGTFPANSATYCTAYYNCITSYTTCPAVYPNLPQPSYGCQFCGTTNALGTACMGNPCVPVTPSPITAVNKWNPVPVMRCDPVPIQATQAAALQAMVPGLWTQPTCTIAGQAYIAGTLPRVFCNPAGLVLDIVLNGVKASGFFPPDSSKLSALTRLDFSVNFFTNRIDTFLAPFLPIKTLNTLRLHQNYLSGSFPASISALTALTELRLNLNYLTGSMPAALPASLKVIDLSSNYLVGTFPTTTATSVACASNCLQDASKCPAGSAQRAAGGCAICETTDATGRMCGGGVCTPNATDLITAQTVNPDTAPLYCLGASMDPAMAAALLNMRASLGVTFTDWALDSPCTIQGLPPLPGAWSNVICNVSGKVMSINLAQQKLQGTMHADISKLTALTYINLRSNLLEGRLDVFTTNFKALTALKEAYFDFNWFTGPIPSTLVTIATLSTFGASYNYLYGSIPAPGAALKAIALDGNWLSGTFPGTGFSSCSATSNCLASIGACTTLGTVQRAAAACAVCDTADGSGTVCGGGTCAPDTAAPLSTSTPNSATAAVLPRFCVGVPLDATQGNILLALKTTLGATFSDWTASTLAAPKATSTKPKKGPKRRSLQGRGSGLLYDWKAVGSCTIQGQTPIAGSWTGVRCSPLGQVVSLRLSSNLFFSRLDSYIVPITPTASLKELHINFNWFYGTVPTTLVNMPALSILVVSYNYLTGTLPKPGASLKALDTEFNFLSGSFPVASLAYCTARSNCFVNATACLNLDGTVQRGAGCNVCGSSNGQLPLCGGAVCTPDPSAYVTSKVPNSASAPTLALKCPSLPLDATSWAALVNIGAALVNIGAALVNIGAALVNIGAALVNIGAALGGTHRFSPMSCFLSSVRAAPPHSSAFALHLGYNLLYGRLSTFISNITPLTAIVTLNLNFNYLYDSVPSTLFNMASLTEIRLSANYLTGTLPAVPTKLKYLAVNHNFLAGAFPNQAFQFCDIRSNCFSNLGSCYNAYGVAQRTSGCNICATTNAAPPLCSGAPCVLNATNVLAAGTVNSLTAVVQPFYCGPAIIDATAAQALLVLRVALGVTQTSWLVDSPCDIAGNPPMPGSWAGVGCDTTGKVLTLELPNMGLRGDLPADVSKLTALTRINMASNLLEARLGEWATVLTTLKALKHLALNYNWFAGPLPSYLLTLSTLTTLAAHTRRSPLSVSSIELNHPSPRPTSTRMTTTSQATPRMPVPPMTCHSSSSPLSPTLHHPSPCSPTYSNLQFNYLTGTITGVPAAALKTINVASNFLAGSFPASSTTMCDARNNCLLDASKCVSSGSSVQRAAAACAICGYANASTLLCGGGVCAPNTTLVLPTKTPNTCSAACESLCLLPLPPPFASSLCLLCCSQTLLSLPCAMHSATSAFRSRSPTLPLGLFTPLDPPARFLAPPLPAVPILTNLKTALGVPHQGWGVQTLCTVTGIYRGPQDMSAVNCNIQGGVVDIFLKQRFLRGTMHPDISKFTALTALDMSSNFLSGRLDPFIAPLTGLTALKYLVMSYNFFSGSLPSTISSIKGLYMLSVGWNYLTGSVPVLGTSTLQVLDLENNWFTGKFPTTANWYFCTARANCFIDPTPCKNNNNQGITQRPSCAICNSADGTGTLCGGIVACQPDPAAVKAATSFPTTSTPVLPLTCPPVPPVTTDATAASALMNIKTALGVTYTNWAASSTCTAVGSAGGGGFTGVECDSLGNPVKITLDNQKLFGILHADITKLTALTFISLKSNLFRARLDEFSSRIPALPNLAVLLLDFNWFFGSLPPAVIGMPKLTRLGLSYNYLTYRVPPVSAAIKDLDVGFNFLSGSFPANTATSCGANSNCFQSAATCATKGTAQRTSGCNFCQASTGQGMLCYGRGVCTVNASAPFAAGTPNAVGAPTLPFTCVTLPFLLLQRTVSSLSLSPCALPTCPPVPVCGRADIVCGTD